MDYRWLCKDPAFISEQVDHLQDPAARPDAIYNLGALCQHDAVPTLLPFAENPDARIRRLLSEALARMGEPWARETLERLTRDDEIETVFLMADVSLQPIASKLVKEIAVYGGDIAAFVSPSVCDDVVSRVEKIGMKGDY